MSEPKCGRRINGDCEEYLSVDCTVAHLMANEQARAVLAPLMAAAQEKMAEKYGDQMERMDQTSGKMNAGLGAKMTLRSALQYGNVPEAAIEQLDSRLGKIRND